MICSNMFFSTYWCIPETNRNENYQERQLQQQQQQQQQQQREKQWQSTCNKKTQQTLS